MLLAHAASHAAVLCSVALCLCFLGECRWPMLFSALFLAPVVCRRSRCAYACCGYVDMPTHPRARQTHLMAMRASLSIVQCCVTLPLRLHIFLIHSRPFFEVLTGWRGWNSRATLLGKGLSIYCCPPARTCCIRFANAFAYFCSSSLVRAVH